MAALGLRRLHQRQRLDEQHREDTRHQVQDDAADQCEPQSPEQSGLPRNRSTRRIVQPGIENAAALLGMNFVSRATAQHDNAAQYRRDGLQVRIFLEF